jgi:hypothetical protein
MFGTDRSLRSLGIGTLIFIIGVYSGFARPLVAPSVSGLPFRSAGA